MVLGQRAGLKEPRTEPQSLGKAPLADVPKMRVVFWILSAAIIIVGLVFYFRYGTQVAPALT